MKRWLFALTVFLVSLSACAGKDPKRIASYPSNPNEPVRLYPGQPQAQQVSIELEVSNVRTAAADADALAEYYGASRVSSQEWYEADRLHMAVVFAVPSSHFENLYRDLLSLGRPVSGSGVSMEGSRLRDSHIAVVFASRDAAWPVVRLPLTGWDPAQTVERASRVFLTLFGFLADGLLWIVIVIGPFALVGWGGWAIARRLRR
jgi:hypothetical protein